MNSVGGKARNGKLLREGNFPKSGNFFRETGKIGKILKLKKCHIFSKILGKKGDQLNFSVFKNVQKSSTTNLYQNEFFHIHVHVGKLKNYVQNTGINLFFYIQGGPK